MLAYAAMPSSRSGLLACPASPSCTGSASRASVPRSTTERCCESGKDRPADDQRRIRPTSRPPQDHQPHRHRRRARQASGSSAGTPWCATAAPMASRPSAASASMPTVSRPRPAARRRTGGRHDRALAYRRRPRGAGHPDGHRGQRQGRAGGLPTAAARARRPRWPKVLPMHILAAGWRPGDTSSLPPGGLVVTLTRISTGPGLDPHDNLPASQARRGRHHDGTGLPLRPGPGTDVAVRPAARVAQEPDALRRRGAHISLGILGLREKSTWGHLRAGYPALL